MKVESVKLVLDACAEAAHIEQLLPELLQIDVCSTGNVRGFPLNKKRDIRPTHCW